MTSPAGGELVAADTRCRWTIDGGALHLYGFSGSGALDALVGQAERIAREQFAAVCVTTLDSADPRIEGLMRCGFELDESELTVRGGEVRTDVTLIRPLSPAADRTPTADRPPERSRTGSPSES
jgi:hypothetical protein